MPLFVNKVMLAGNLTREVESRAVGADRTVANFGLAINRRWKDRDGQQQEEATFVDVECWGRTAELCAQYLSKGRNVHIEGRLRLDQFQDKEGNNRSKLKVVADQVNFIGGKDDAGGGQQRQAAAPVDLGDDEPPW